MSLLLQDKVILITGACGKLGKSAVRLFLEKGAIVIASDKVVISEHPAMCELLDNAGADRLMLVQADVSDEPQVKMLMDLIDRRFGKLDGSFHNAYSQIHRPLADYELTEWEDVVSGTLTSTFLVCKFAVKLMLKSGGGVILNTSSVLGERPQEKCAAYGASKAAVNQLTRVLALDYAANGIRANCIVPGDFMESGKEVTQKEIDGMRKVTLIGRSGRADEISELAAFLLSDSASYITGSLHTIDGGYRL